MTKNKADTASDAGRDLLARHGGRRFHTILADPPWQFQNRTGKMAPEHKRLSRYGTMTLGKIKFKVCANAEWIDDINLKVMVRPVETVGMRTLNFLFRRNNKVTITPTSTPSTYKIVDTLSRSFTEIIKNPLLSKICQKAIQIAPPLAEPKHYGKIV